MNRTMNFEEALHKVTQTLQSEYQDYGIIEARRNLENRIIFAEMTEAAHPHLATQSVPADSADSAATPQTPNQPVDWKGRAVCRTYDPDWLFVRGAAQRQAKLVCNTCPVRARCLAEALDRRIEYGVWGGMTERERRALLRRRPDVQSWAELLENAAKNYDSEHAEEAKRAAG